MTLHLILSTLPSQIGLVLLSPPSSPDLSLYFDHTLGACVHPHGFEEAMDSSSEVPDQLIIFSLLYRNHRSHSRTNPLPIPESTSTPSLRPNPNPVQFFPFLVPKKPRRGRRQCGSARTSFHILPPPLPPPHSLSSDTTIITATNFGDNNFAYPPPPPSSSILSPNSSVRDFGDEIRVINKKSADEALIALSAGFGK